MSVVEGTKYPKGHPWHDLGLVPKHEKFKPAKIKYNEWWFQDIRGKPLVHCRGNGIPFTNEKYMCGYKGNEDIGIRIWFCGSKISERQIRSTDDEVYVAAHKVRRRRLNTFERRLIKAAQACNAVPSRAEDIKFP